MVNLPQHRRGGKNRNHLYQTEQPQAFPSQPNKTAWYHLPKDSLSKHRQLPILYQRDVKQLQVWGYQAETRFQLPHQQVSV